MVVAEKPTETWTAPNGTDALRGCHGLDEFVPEPLMVSFGREARRLNVPVLVTHPGDNVSEAQFMELKKMGAYIEVNADFYQEGDTADEKVAFAVKQIKRLGAESIIMGTDCGQINNPLPADCIALGARALRTNGVTDRQLDLMLKETPLGRPRNRRPPDRRA